jgi:hypothetical protein
MVASYAVCFAGVLPQGILLALITDPSQGADDLLAKLSPSLTDDEKAFVLALRGLLAHGILQHCLQKRHRVDYGVFRYDLMYGNMLSTQPPLVSLSSNVSTESCTQLLFNANLHRSPAARKRLAVPFRAADTPAERSEYAQPDVALMLTALRWGLLRMTDDAQTFWSSMSVTSGALCKQMYPYTNTSERWPHGLPIRLQLLLRRPEPG